MRYKLTELHDWSVLNEAIRGVERERDALRAEVERMKEPFVCVACGKNVTRHELTSSLDRERARAEAWKKAAEAWEDVGITDRMQRRILKLLPLDDTDAVEAIAEARRLEEGE